MPRRPIAMYGIKGIPRLHYATCHTRREISRAVGVSQPAIQRLLKRAARRAWAGRWPSPRQATRSCTRCCTPRRHRRGTAAARLLAQVQAQWHRHKWLSLEQL